MENDSHALFVTKKGIHLGIEMKYYENGEDKVMWTEVEKIMRMV